MSKLTPELRDLLFSSEIRAYIRAVTNRYRASPDDRDEFAQELYARVLSAVERGWFDKPPTTSRLAQMKNLIGTFIAPDVLRKRLEAADDFELAEDPDRAQPEPESESDETGPDTLEAQQQLQQLDQAWTKLQNPAHRLVLKFKLAPESIALSDVQAAAAYRASGHTYMKRPADEAFALIQQHLLKGPPNASALFAEIIAFDTPLGTASEADIKTAVNTKLDKPFERAKQALRLLLEETP